METNHQLGDYSKDSLSKDRIFVTVPNVDSLVKKLSISPRGSLGGILSLHTKSLGNGSSTYFEDLSLNQVQEDFKSIVGQVDDCGLGSGHTCDLEVNVNTFGKDANRGVNSLEPSRLGFESNDPEVSFYAKESNSFL